MSDRPDWDAEERDALSGLADDAARMRQRHRDDPPLEMLRAARADALPTELQEPIARHLSESEWSRTLLDAGDKEGEALLAPADVDRLFDRISAAAPQPSRGRRGAMWRPVLAAAASIVVVASLWTAVRPGRTPSPASTDTRSATVPRPTFALPLDTPEVRVSAAALTWRGPARSTSLADDLAPGLDAFRRSDFTAAAAALEPVERRYPETVEAPFYRGVALLFLNDPVAAQAELEKAARVADETFARDASWYLAIAEQRAGRVSAARAHLEVLCRTPGTRTTQACDAVKALDRDLR